MKKKVIIAILVGFTLAGAFAQQEPRIRQLDELIRSGEVSISATGNGASSGLALTGTIKNNTSGAVYINSNTNGLFMRNNNGQAQNMLVTSVYFRNTGYYAAYNSRFILVKPNELIEVIYQAYCLNMDRDSPQANETLTFESMPRELSDIAAKITRFIAAYPNQDNRKAVQVFLWLQQGHNDQDIARYFVFSPIDREKADLIAMY
ncbi:MAG: hypothetical protein FWD28_01625 [Treponema sp.]|nr:hypothetical protein [Treponema sp.]